MLMFAGLACILYCRLWLHALGGLRVLGGSVHFSVPGLGYALTAKTNWQPLLACPEKYLTFVVLLVLVVVGSFFAAFGWHR